MRMKWTYGMLFVTCKSENTYIFLKKKKLVKSDAIAVYVLRWDAKNQYIRGRKEMFKTREEGDKVSF